MTRLSSMFLSAVLIALPVSSMAAYEGGDVKDGGTISGTVKFKGTAPAPKKLDVSKDKEVCGKTPLTDESLIVSNGNLVNAVVTITDISKGKKMEVGKFTLDQQGCRYHPHVLAFPAGSTVTIVNPDGILHNIHSFSKVNTAFNMAQPKFKKPWMLRSISPRPSRCDAMFTAGWRGGWLRPQIRILLVTDNSGSFKLTDVPPGTYTVEVWQQKLGKTTQKVTVKAKEDAKVNFEMAGK